MEITNEYLIGVIQNNRTAHVNQAHGGQANWNYESDRGKSCEGCTTYALALADLRVGIVPEWLRETIAIAKGIANA